MVARQNSFILVESSRKQFTKQLADFICVFYVSRLFLSPRNSFLSNVPAMLHLIAGIESTMRVSVSVSVSVGVCVLASVVVSRFIHIL